MVLGFSKPVLPHIVQDVPLPAYIPGAGGISIPEYRQRPYYIVLSMDLGNTVSDCIIIGTNLETGITYTINSTVRMTRDIRPPKEGEQLFGRTVDGIVVSQNAVVEFVRDTVRQCIREANIDVTKLYLGTTNGLPFVYSDLLNFFEATNGITDLKAATNCLQIQIN
jgi:hypothetical protein